MLRDVAVFHRIALCWIHLFAAADFHFCEYLVIVVVVVVVVVVVIGVL